MSPTENASDEPLTGESRPPKRTMLACTRCRQQKFQMKCSGGSVPPCDRCRKANSFCHFESPSAQQQAQQPPAVPGQQSHRQPQQSYVPYSNGYLEQQSFIALPPVVMTAHQDASPPSDSHRQEPSPQTTTITSTLNFGADEPTTLRSDAAPDLEHRPLSPPENTECPPGKRRRTCYSAAGSTDSAVDRRVPEVSAGRESPLTASSSPFQVVQDFEANHRRPPVHVDSGPSVSDLSPSLRNRAASGGAIFTGDLHGKQALSKCLAAVDLSFADASDMFALFGDRVAPFIPWLYDQDFTHLPDDPLFVLSCLRAIARYLPGVDSLWRKLEGVVASLLQQAIFDDLRRPYEAVLETFKGLGIVYGYSEVGVVGSIDDVMRPKFDTLSVKGIIEGYAVRWNIGKPHPSNTIGCMMWLWLYTMSNYYSIVLGCPRTLPAGRHLSKAREIVAQSRTHTQVSVLLAELDLCLASDPGNPLGSQPGCGGESGRADHEWDRIMASLDTTATAEGRRLQFHRCFAKFYRASKQAADRNAPIDATILHMARSFLHCITKSSPASKGRLTYMPEFGVVMLVFVCCFVLRFPAPEPVEGVLGGMNPDSLDRAAIIRDILDVADLLTSFSSKEGSIAAAYGRALREACRAQEVSAFPPSVSGRRSESPVRTTSYSAGLYMNGHGDRGEARAVGLTHEDADGGAARYGSLGQGQGSMQDVPAHMNANGHMPDTQPEGHNPTPWYGTSVDVPGGLLLDTLIMPWEYGWS